jgi:hypothetical protein
MQNRKQNRNWLKLISESYVQMNEMEEIDPSQHPYYRYYEPEYERINPEDVRDEMLPGLAGGIGLEIFAERFLRDRALPAAAQSAIRAFILGGAVSLSGLIAALLAAGLSLYLVYQIAQLLAQAIDDYNGTSPDKRLPPILPQHLRKVFPGGVPAPDPQITPGVLHGANPNSTTYPGQHPWRPTSPSLPGGGGGATDNPIDPDALN